MQTSDPPSGQQHPPYSTSPALAQLDCVSHGFFGAEGGVSEGRYRSLNCGYSSADSQQCVADNRGRVAACMGLQPDRLHSLKQVHSPRVVILDRRSGPQFANEADGMVCAVPGVGLGPLGADCAPVLYVDSNAGVIGAAHSGWKGALDGINEAVIDAMEALGAQRERIIAAIGPAMQQRYYEVQADFRTLFESGSPIDSAPWFSQRDHRLYFDTPGYIRARLLASGIGRIDLSEEDTFSQAGRYFSYRRSRQAGEDDYGRQVAVIALEA